MGKAAVAVVLVMFGLVFLTGVGASNPAVVRTLSGTLAIADAVLLVRVARAGVVMRPDALVVRGWTRTRIIARNQISDVVVVDSRNVTGAAACVGINLRDGSTVRALPTASYSHKKAATYRDTIATAESFQQPG